MSSLSITVIIISRGLEGMLRFCLKSLSRALGSVSAPVRTVIVDNASEFPYNKALFDDMDITFMRFDMHSSFSRACNRAANERPGDFFFLLNNDVLLHEKALSSMVDFSLAHSEAGICGGRLIFPDNTIQHCGVVFGTADIGPYHCFYKTPNHLVPRVHREYQAVTGACMLVKGEVWAALGGLDERYAFGLEDIDFCLRARQRGWKVYCCNEFDSLHFEAMTPGRATQDVPSRRLFMETWRGHYCIDG